MVFPGQKVARLSDYVKLMKAMQTGNMMGALGQFRGEIERQQPGDQKRKWR